MKKEKEKKTLKLSQKNIKKVGECDLRRQVYYARQNKETTWWTCPIQIDNLPTFSFHSPFKLIVYHT